jgi:hypothetical protein
MAFKECVKYSNDILFLLLANLQIAKKDIVDSVLKRPNE